MERTIQACSCELIAMVEWITPASYTLATTECLIGRMTTCDVVAQLSLVSRQHARIERQGVRYLLTDLGSANGTYVNGQRLAEPRLLLDGDLIGLGSNTPALRFTDPDATNFTPTLLVFDERMLLFFVGQTTVTLTPSQHRFLVHLYRNQGRVCTREECAEAVWGNQCDPGSNAGRLDQLVSAVRLALRNAAGDQADVVEKVSTIIQARRGLGYSLQL